MGLCILGFNQPQMEFESMDVQPMNTEVQMYYPILYKTWASVDYGIHGGRS